ncbi:MAG: hypothetical protein H0T62_10025 [Parachlamydiaceae bacterium]|nr:hypothetical protein [Parachlamydiaceae bacterium]
MFNLLKKSILLLLLPFTIYAGPSERHLQLRPLSEIFQDLEPEIQEKIPLLMEIAGQENEDTFFAYHGMSQNNRIFQDILHAVFEEVLNIPLPKDFYFLRVPNENKWNWENHKDTFFKHYGNFEAPKEMKNLVLENLLRMINKQQNVNLIFDDFTPQEKTSLWLYFQDYIDCSFHSNWTSKVEKYAIPVDYQWKKPVFNSYLPLLTEVITKKIQSSCPNYNLSSLNHWLESMFSTQFGVYNVFRLREIDPPADPAIIELLGNSDLRFNDTRAPQKSELISLNTAILANSCDIGCFTARIFLTNKSVLNGDAVLENELKELFECIGLESSLASKLWEKGQNKLSELNVHEGCLLQFFDESALRDGIPFKLVDLDTYVSFKHGIPIPNLISSDYVKGEYSLRCGSRDLELRLVVNNRTVLNPFSNFRIVRHDSLSQKESAQLILSLKEDLRNSSKNQEKIKKYVTALNRMWNTFFPQ